MVAYTKPSQQRVNPKNLSSLKQLVRSIDLAGDQFCLILACCNRSKLRQQMIEQLHHLCTVPLEEIRLESSTETLYGTIANHLSLDVPGAVMVYGFESVRHLKELLIATNYVREEFCKFKFPIILWVTDDVIKQLVRVVPDFFSWASTGIEFVDEF